MARWFDHVEAAAAHAGVTPSYIFVVEPQDETLPILLEHTGHRSLIFNLERGPYEDRGWAQESRVHHMVRLRNILLAAVREDGPEVFLSVDSDVLVSREAIADLLESLGRFPAVGGGTFMGRPYRGPGGYTPGANEHLPSCGWIVGKSGFRRQYMEHRGVIPVGVIMAIKAMSPMAYAVDYRYNREGEDIGWSLAAAKAGLRLGWDNRHPSKHVMDPIELDRIDERCGF